MNHHQRIVSHDHIYTRYFLDTEFIEDGKTIDLVSIGIVCEERDKPVRELYCVNQEARLDLASDWVRQNVLKHLPLYGDDAWATRREIAESVKSFVRTPDNIEFWGYYADYDWVALCQLFGKMIDLPNGFPMHCMDLKQYAHMLGAKRDDFPQQKGVLHNALEDARWNRELYHWLREQERV